MCNNQAFRHIDNVKLMCIFGIVCQIVFLLLGVAIGGHDRIHLQNVRNYG